MEFWEFPNSIFWEHIVGEPIATVITLLVTWVFWGRKVKGSLLKDSHDYWEIFDSHTNGSFFQLNEIDELFEYVDDKKEHDDLRNIARIKDSVKCSYTLTQILRPYSRMAILWSERKLDITEIDRHCAYELLHISRIGIIERCKEDSELYEKLAHLRKLICNLKRYRDNRKRCIIKRGWYRIFYGYRRKCKN